MDERLCKSWIERINREDTFPKLVVVCEDHFEEERKWIKMGSPAHNKLKEILLQSELVKDMEK